MADWTGLEPATPGVTGRYSNQLNYQSALSMLYLHQKVWWVMTGSNRRPSACKADALPAELITQSLISLRCSIYYCVVPRSSLRLPCGMPWVLAAVRLVLISNIKPC